MNNDVPRDISAELEAGSTQTPDEHYVLVLYVAGHTSKSAKAIANIKKITDNELEGRYDLEIVDVYQDPHKAASEQLFALPTLIKKLPAPLRKVIGDLSDIEKVLVGLNLRPRQSE